MKGSDKLPHAIHLERSEASAERNRKTRRGLNRLPKILEEVIGRIHRKRGVAFPENSVTISGTDQRSLADGLFASDEVVNQNDRRDYRKQVDDPTRDVQNKSE